MAEDIESAIPARDGRAPAEERVRRLRGLATVLDSAVRVPGTNIRFGLDALLGLVPGIGDVAGGLASGYVLVEAARLGASRPTLVRMLGNILVEVVLGAAPVLGDLFDVGWKANARNVDLLESHLAKRSAAAGSVETGRGRTVDGRSPAEVGVLFVTGLLSVLALAILGVLWIVIAVVRAF